MVGRSRRTPLDAETHARIKLDAVAQRAGYRTLPPDERAAVIAELQEIAAAHPHILGQRAGLYVGKSRNEPFDKERLLRSAQLLIEAGADLGQVEQWTSIGYERSLPPAGDPSARRRPPAG